MVISLLFLKLHALGRNSLTAATMIGHLKIFLCLGVKFVLATVIFLNSDISSSGRSFTTLEVMSNVKVKHTFMFSGTL
jgi:hypothetical protein